MASEVYHRRASSRDVELAPDRQDRVRKKKSSRLELFDLPAEILWRILGIFCNDPVEVVSISLVCKAFRQMTNNEQLWQRVCLNRFGFVAPETVSMSGSWMTVMRDKTAIENSPWIVKPKECAQLVYNDLLGVTSLAINDKFVVCGGGGFDEPFDVCTVWVERTVNIYDRKTLRLHQNLQSRLGTVFSVELSDDYLIACGGGGKARLWKYDETKGEYEFRRTFKGQTRAVFCCKFDKRTVLTGTRDGFVTVWDFRSASELYSIQAHSAAVHDIDWDRRNMLSVSRDKVGRYWQIETGQCISELPSKNWALCTQMKGNLALIGGEGKTKLWDLRSGTVVRKFACNTLFPPSWITCAEFDDNKVVAGSFNRNAYIWDVGSGRLINRWAAHEDKISGLYLADNHLYTASRDRTVKKWDFDTQPVLLQSYPPRRSPHQANCSVM